MSIRTVVAESIATITLDRPEKLNAFGGTMREDLLKALHACEIEESVRCIVVTGAGRAFCAGGDIDFMSGLQKDGDTASFAKLLDAGRDIVLKIVSMPKPVVASVNGIAAGAGCNLALACDVRIASDQAKFSESFVRIGLHPDWGGSWFLPRLIGPGRAFEMMATGRMVDAAEAAAIGLVQRVVPAAELEAAAGILARSLAAAPPVAIAGIKRALSQSAGNALEDHLQLEKEHQTRCFLSRDAAEGMAAFFEKRAAAFKGN